MSYHQTWQQDRWQQASSSPEYSTMNSMVYEPQTLPSTTTMQPRPTMTPQYPLPTTYAESPVTPMSTSSYTSHQGHFGDYQQQSYSYQHHATSYSDQMPMRHSQRPMAPPTPPLEDDRGMRHYAERTDHTVRSTARRTPRRSVSVVKSETGSESRGVDKRIRRKLVKEDGRTLQHESNKIVDKLLAVAAELKLNVKDESSAASTPESMASPATEETYGKPKVKKDKHCKFCDRSFSQKAQLVTHTRSHTSEKPFQCQTCGLRVSQPGNLKAHERTHSGEKPYRCPYVGEQGSCGQLFASNGGLKVHVRNKHQGSPPKHDCPIPGCDKTFTTIGNMKVHINKFHEVLLYQYLDMITKHDKSTPFPEDVAELWSTLLQIYQNSNCGIKGRGVEDKATKEFNKLRKEQALQAKHARAAPISPDASPAIRDYRAYYDEREQHHYPAHPAQQHQQPMYLQQMPAHQAPIYHGLPQPAPYGLQWSGQYH